MKKGFTLIEIIITISLFTSLSLFAFPVALSYLQGSDGDIISRQILNDLVEAQQNSYTKKSKTFNSSTEVCSGASFTTISTQRIYNTFLGTWDSTNYLCTNRVINQRSVVGTSPVSASVDEIIFTPGSYKPYTFTGLSISSNTITGSGTPSFTNVLKNGDQIAPLSNSTNCATISSLTSTSFTTSIVLGDGENQTLVKCVNITTSNNSSTYVVYLTDEGMLYYKKTL